METLVVPPFVAAGIVEHAKRRQNSAGYLFGSYSDGQVTVTDYIPCTHELENNEIPQSHIDDFNARVEVKKHYNPGVGVVGWYAAGAPRPGAEREFQRWCEAPGAIFTRKASKSQALMLLARMPSATDMSLKWEAHIISTSPQGEGRAHERNKMEVKVKIAAESHSMNALLADIASKALYNGGAPNVTSRITNLDLVARGAEMGELEDSGAGGKKDNRREGDRPVEEALIKVQNGMMQEIANAEAMLAAGNSGGGGDVDYAAIVESHNSILEEKANQGERGDFITETYTDALAIKYQMHVLRRVLNDIERSNNPEGRDRPHHHGNNNQGNRPNRANNLR